MTKKTSSIALGIALVLVISLVIVAVSYSAFATTCEIGTAGLAVPEYDFLSIPQSVVEDATSLATELFGNCQEKCNNLVHQLLAIYSRAKDKDFVVVFNPGGFGYKSLEHAPGWSSIFTGIESELAGLGYTSLLLQHLRTNRGLPAYLDELGQRFSGYRSKAENLASRLEFLIRNIPNLKIIVTGESTGTVICDRVMNILQDNQQVYSIQTGPPFWHRNIMLDRTLVMTDNGITPDSYSRGDFWAILWGNLQYWFHLSPPQSDFGTLPHYVGAPGHDYWWQYPQVGYQIRNFLSDNFAIK